MGLMGTHLTRQFRVKNNNLIIISKTPLHGIPYGRDTKDVSRELPAESMVVPVGSQPSLTALPTPSTYLKPVLALEPSLSSSNASIPPIIGLHVQSMHTTST